MNQPQPLEREGRLALAEAIGDTPWTVIAVHALRHGFCRAYTVGSPSKFLAAIVQWDDLPDEPSVFGDDVEALWHLLQNIEGWRVVNVRETQAEQMRSLMERDLGLPVHLYGDVHFTLEEPPAPYHHPLVRQLTPADAPLLEAAPRAIQGAGFGGPAQLLNRGIVAGAVDGERLVAIAHTSAMTERYADVGVATLEPYRGQGISTAAASLVCRAVQEARRTPVWSTGEDNWASLRVAEKVGFTPIGQRKYVIPARE